MGSLLSFVQNENSGSSMAHENDSNLRVNKDDFFMVLALCMEDFPVDERKPEVDEKTPEKAVDYSLYRKVGAVLVINDLFYAADCTQDGVHAVARLLTKHYDKAKGAKVFLSRKPCPVCTKLLVQSKVKRVLYLPMQPEYITPKETSDGKIPLRQQVDSLFTASAIAQTKFVPQINKGILDNKVKNIIRKQKTS